MPKQPIRSHFRQLKKAQNSKQEGEKEKKKKHKIYLDTDETNFNPTSSQGPFCEPGAHCGEVGMV